MIKRITQTLVVAVLLAFCANPGKAAAQSTCDPNTGAQCIVSGGDPEPIGHIVSGGTDGWDDPIVSGGDPEPIGHFLDPNDPDLDLQFLFAIFMLFGIA